MKSPLASTASGPLEPAELASSVLVADAVPEPGAATEATAPPAGAKGEGGSSSLREKVYKGAAWSTLAALMTQGLNLARLISLPRLLSPSDVGMANLLLTIISALGLLTNLGMGSVLVTRRFEDEGELNRYMNTAWSFEIVRNAGFSLLLCLAAFPVARWMGQPLLGPLLVASCVSPFLYSFHNIGLTLYRREVNIAKTTQFELSCAVLTVVLTIGFAWWTRSVWGIVIANVFFSICLVALSYWFHPYRPRPAFDREAFKVGFRFGQSVFVGGLMAYIATTADNIIVGKVAGTAVLGVYATIYGVAALPQKLISGLLGSILFPSFAAAAREGGEQVERIIARAFVLGCSLLALIILPLFLLSSEVLTIFGKAAYEAAAPLLRVMLIGGLFRSLTQILSPLVHGLGRPEIDAKASTIEAGVFVALVTALTFRFGAMGAAWAGVIAYGLSFVIRALWCRPLAPRAFAALPRTLLTSLLCVGGGWGAGVFVLSLAPLAHAGLWARALLGGGVSLGVAMLELAVLFPALGDEAAKVMALLKSRARG